ncbi:2-phospho-L-lactate guanylyltransferase [Saccharopolyspora mangrovi]|uniref:2-phospho-L-lactate guanylyltransferase n=1 Tax=Saccharopolyspora mangrovi TaxID=3082379 RepID=A0ABU6AC07_9PSEU|nr:2-phospho-L-lactate guanylyltransferase [Saccharopolyspora sp. S2-29]MEB3369001.1 2-phospho-L-lactate guanylyltransferase [Saccharopolyspora sp. S2-29]
MSNHPAPQSARWDVVIPLKAIASAKSRLELGAMRPRLAWTMARDTVVAVAECEAVRRIVVVTADTTTWRSLPIRGLTVLSDPGGGLQQAVRTGVDAVAKPSEQRGIAVLTGDLPAARSSEWATAFELAERHPMSFIADTAGTGTTAFFMRSDSSRLPRFGERSRTAHLDMGAVELSHPSFTTVRRDVDTRDDLREALALGVGPNTQALMRTSHDVPLQ